MGKKSPPIYHEQSVQKPQHGLHNTDTTADLSTCNGTSAILGQHKVWPDHDKNERTRPVTTPLVPLSQNICPCFVPVELDYDAAVGASLMYTSDDVVLVWQPPSAFPLWTPSSFTVDLVEYNCAEQFMMTSKLHPFGDDLAFSAILATDDLQEQKRLAVKCATLMTTSDYKNGNTLSYEAAQQSSHKTMKFVLPSQKLTNATSPKPALVIIREVSA